MAFIDRDMPRFDTEQTRDRLRAIQDDEEQRRRDLLTRLMGLRMSGDAMGFGWRAGAEGGRNVGAEIALQNETNMARAMRPEHFQEIIEKGETKFDAGAGYGGRGGKGRNRRGGFKEEKPAVSDKEPSGPRINAQPGSDYQYDNALPDEQDWQIAMREAQEKRQAEQSQGFGTARETERSKERRLYRERTGFNR